MSKIIAIDYGKKRIGIAETDDLQIIASSLTTVENGKIFDFLTNYFNENSVEIVIIGEPKTLDNNLNEIEKDIIIFIQKFNIKFPWISVKRIDERFTSKMASFTINQSGLPKNKRRNKNLIDQISATLILQSYLENKF